MAGPYNIGDILPAIPASKLKAKSNLPLITAANLFNQNTTGAGITYTITGPALLLGASLSGLTVNDTKYTLAGDGVIIAQNTTGVSSIEITILNTGYTTTTPTAVASNLSLGTPISCLTSFTLFVQSTSDTNINVQLNYLELA